MGSNKVVIFLNGDGVYRIMSGDAGMVFEIIDVSRGTNVAVVWPGTQIDEEEYKEMAGKPFDE
jgi:hypothetical protein